MNIGDTVSWERPFFSPRYGDYNYKHIIAEVIRVNPVVIKDTESNGNEWDPSVRPQSLQLICRAYNHDPGDEHED